MRKKCKHCKARFEAENPYQVCCSKECLSALKTAHYSKQKEKALLKLSEKRAESAPRSKPKPIRKQSNTLKAKLLRELIATFNLYVRIRDRDLPCISCGTMSANWHAGHYRTAKANPELRFNEDNVHKQCEHCNIALNGNIAQYRVGLLSRIGEERLERIEGFNPPNHLREFEIRQLIDHYKEKTKEIY